MHIAVSLASPGRHRRHSPEVQRQADKFPLGAERLLVDHLPTCAPIAEIDASLDSVQAAFGGREQVLALARAQRGQLRIAAHNESLTRIVGECARCGCIRKRQALLVIAGAVSVDQDRRRQGDGLLGAQRPPGHRVQTKSYNTLAAVVTQDLGTTGAWRPTRSPAEYGVNLITLQEKHYDFVVPNSRLDRPRVRADARVGLIR